MQTIIIIAVLAVVYGLAFCTRTAVVDYQKMLNPSLPFTLESALLYRYAGMIARGEQIPANDRAAQYPEGLEVRTRLSIAQEYVMGSLYRRFFAHRMMLEDFIRLYSAAFFSLSVIAAYLVVMQLTGSAPAGIIAALFYAVSLPAVMRSTGQEIMGENCALPLIFFHLWGFLKATDLEQPRRTRIIAALFSAACISLSAVAWDMTQVYLFLMAAFAVLCFLFSKQYGRLALPLSFAVCGLIAVCLCNPYLRWHRVFFSYPMIVLSCVVAATFLSGSSSSSVKFRWKLFLVVLLSVSVAAASVFSQYQVTYSHFAQLLYYKIRFLNVKPADPSLLPYTVRTLWVPALQSVGLWDAARFFTMMIPLSAAGGLCLLIAWCRGRLTFAWKYCAFLAVLFVPLYFLFYRMEVFLAFFACVVIGGSVSFLRKRLPKASYLWIVAVALGLLFEAQKTYAGMARWGRNVDYARLGDIVAWTRQHTLPGSVILGTFTLSPSLLAYADRAIVLHPKYEDQALREKVRIFDLSMFSESEEDFYLFCWKTGATHYIHSRGTYSDRSINSRRYLADVMNPSMGTNAYKFEVAPEKLTQFKKLYDNGKYIAYQVIGEQEKKGAREAYEQGLGALRAGKYDDAVACFRCAIDTWPGFYQAYTGIIRAYASRGDTERSAQAAQDLFRRMGVKKVEDVSAEE